LRVSLPISFLAHAAILLAAVIVLPSVDGYKVPEQPSIPVDIVDITDLSQRAATLKDAPARKPDVKPAPPKVEKAKETKPAPKPAKEVKQAAKEPPPAPEPKAEPKPVVEAAKQPDPSQLEALIKKTEAPADQPKPDPQKQADSTPVPIPRLKPKPPADFVKKEKKKFDFNPDQIAALLNKVPEKKAPTKTSDITGTPLKGKFDSLAGNDAQLSADMVDWLRQQVERCWAPPTGVREAQNLMVKVHFALGQDGTVLSGPEVLNPGADALTKAAESSAVRAVLMCAPYKGLPLDKYDIWKDVILNFDPSRMLATN